MIIDEQPIRFRWEFVVTLTEFPALLLIFQQNVPSRPNKPTTAEIEKRAANLADNDFRVTELQSFIKTVCNWGGYPGIAGRIIKNNEINEIATIFRKAYRQALDGDVIEALETLQQIKGLGKVSFASKHLKFLAPERAVVLDSIISERLGYRMNAGGYARFLDDCNTILSHVLTGGLEYTGWAKEGWRVSDIEMAIFAKIKFNLTPPSPFPAA